MSGLLAALLSSRPARWAGAALLVLGAFLGLRAKWRSDGKADAEAEQREAAFKRADDRRKVDEEVDDLDAIERRERLRRWSRD
ncbi:hypothetical protein [Albimonas pacifica]|uniref:hypothetical protein n=1 Tax=Albimonas pacifica TaxID=1114924 RepID=UPI000B89D806|nr:hypothetical protein [Albimonas pacifica]